MVFMPISQGSHLEKKKKKVVVKSPYKYTTLDVQLTSSLDFNSNK